MAIPVLYDHSILSQILLAKWLQKLIYTACFGIMNSRKSTCHHRHWNQVDGSTLLWSDYLIDSEDYCTVLGFAKRDEFLRFSRSTHGHLRIFLSVVVGLRIVSLLGKEVEVAKFSCK